MKKLLYTLSLLAALGCSTTKPVVQATPAPVKIAAIIPARTDIPPGWKEFKSGALSIGLPPGLVDAPRDITDKTIVLSQKSNDISFILQIENTTEELKPYAYGYAAAMEEDGAKTLSAKGVKLEDREMAILIFQLSTTAVGVHFISVVNKVAYNLGCHIDMIEGNENLETRTHLCGLIMRTIEINNVSIK